MTDVIESGNELQFIWPATDAAQWLNIEYYWCCMRSWWQLADQATDASDELRKGAESELISVRKITQMILSKLPTGTVIPAGSLDEVIWVIFLTDISSRVPVAHCGPSNGKNFACFISRPEIVGDQIWLSFFCLFCFCSIFVFTTNVYFCCIVIFFSLSQDVGWWERIWDDLFYVKWDV